MTTIANLLSAMFERRDDLIQEGAVLLTTDDPDAYLVGYADGSLDECEAHIMVLGAFPLAAEIGGPNESQS